VHTPYNSALLSCSLSASSNHPAPQRHAKLDAIDVRRLTLHVIVQKFQRMNEVIPLLWRSGKQFIDVMLVVAQFADDVGIRLAALMDVMNPLRGVLKPKSDEQPNGDREQVQEKSLRVVSGCSGA
jgi:hypothetical protein